MKLNFSTIGADLLKLLAVVSVVAVEAEPIVDMTVPDVAQIYNLSADTAVQAVQAYVTGTAPSQSSTPSTAAPSSAIAQPQAVVTEKSATEAQPGPGLSKVVPA